MGDTFYLIIGIILSIIGVGGIGAAISNNKSCSEYVTATVSSVKVQRHNIKFKLLVTYIPTFTYTFGGKKYSTASHYSSIRSKKYEKGKEYTLRINPKNPNEINEGSNWSLVLFGLIFAAAGITMIVSYFL